MGTIFLNCAADNNSFLYKGSIPDKQNFLRPWGKPQNAGSVSYIVYNPLRSPLFIQADLVGNHGDEFTIRGFAAEVVTTLYRYLFFAHFEFCQ